ncbi:MAG: hypothetical protein WAR22_10210 [Desulfomonilia bacterium]
MEKILFLAGMAGSLGGVGLLFYQGIMYLMHGESTRYTVFSALENGPDFLLSAAQAIPGVAGALQACPLFAALIVVGLVLLYIASRLRNRYA